MKFFLAVANENWICDRLASEWANKIGTVSSPEQADIIWILSPYIWSRIPHNTLRNKNEKWQHKGN